MGDKIFMDAKERLIQLLIDEEFQDDILSLDTPSDDAQKAIVQKYSITEKEYTFAVRFLSGISFRNEKLSPEDIACRRILCSLERSAIGHNSHDLCLRLLFRPENIDRVIVGF